MTELPNFIYIIEMSRIMSMLVAGIVAASFAVSAQAQTSASAASAPLVTPDAKKKLAEIQEVADLVRRHYRGPRIISPNELRKAASIDDILACLDGHCQYFTREEFDQLKSSKMFGIGIILDRKIAGQPERILYVIPRTPAAAEGMHANDNILTVNKVDVTPLQDLQEVGALLSGDKTEIVITVSRTNPATGRTEDLSFTMTRDAIKSKNVFSKPLENNWGYIYIRELQEKTASDVLREIASLKDGGADKLIIDLRHNVGGIGDEATMLASAFLARDKVIATFLNETGTDKTSAAVNGLYKDMPVKILVDGSTMSSAEIFAAALHEQDPPRAVIIGSSPTFGKGVGQEIFPLSSGGAVALTNGRWFTPTGHSVDRDSSAGKGGIEPDPGNLVLLDHETEVKILRNIYGQLDGEITNFGAESDPVLARALQP
jgi:C-terminal peptidase prc